MRLARPLVGAALRFARPRVCEFARLARPLALPWSAMCFTYVRTYVFLRVLPERLLGTAEVCVCIRTYVRTYVLRMYVCTYVRMYVCTYVHEWAQS